MSHILCFSPAITSKKKLREFTFLDVTLFALLFAVYRTNQGIRPDSGLIFKTAPNAWYGPNSRWFPLFPVSFFLSWMGVRLKSVHFRPECRHASLILVHFVHNSIRHIRRVFLTQAHRVVVQVVLRRENLVYSTEVFWHVDFVIVFCLISFMSLNLQTPSGNATLVRSKPFDQDGMTLAPFPIHKKYIQLLFYLFHVKACQQTPRKEREYRDESRGEHERER